MTAAGKRHEPDGVNEHQRGELPLTEIDDLKAEIEHLRRLLEGSRLLALGIMISLVHSKVVTAEALSQALGVMSKYAEASLPSGTSLPIEHAKLLLNDLCHAGDMDPQRALLHIVMGNLESGPEGQNALRSWLKEDLLRSR
jgi:hypothetical protein